MASRFRNLLHSLNFTARDRISVALTGFALPATILACIHGGAGWLAPTVTLAPLAPLNWPLFRFFARAAGWRQAVLFSPLLLTYFATCIAGFAGGLALAEHRRDRLFWSAAAPIAAVLLALQVAGGAYRAEFDGHPDEAAHLVSGLMVHDHLATLPRGNAIAWAGQYYLHYPKVAIGQWPPGYHALEALWWLFVGPSRTTAMLLQWGIGVVALTALYRLCRFCLPLPVTAGIIAFTIAAPVFQQSLEMTMADLCCLLWSVLLMSAAVRLVQRQDRSAVLMVILWISAAALTKGTAVCLLPVPIAALLASGQRIRIPARWLVAAPVFWRALRGTSVWATSWLGVVLAWVPRGLAPGLGI